MRLATVLKNLKREISKQLLHLVVVFKHVNLSKTGILIIYIYIYIYTHTHTHTHTHNMAMETPFVKSTSIQRYAQLELSRL